MLEVGVRRVNDPDQETRQLHDCTVPARWQPERSVTQRASDCGEAPDGVRKLSWDARKLGAVVVGCLVRWCPGMAGRYRPAVDDGEVDRLLTAVTARCRTPDAVR